MSGRGLVIVGAGGHGREVLDIVEANGLRSTFAGFADDLLAAPGADPEALERLRRRSTAVVGDVAWLATTDHDWIIGIGSSGARRSVDAVLAGGHGSAVTLVHPSAVVGSENHLEAGVVVGAGATITTNVRIGRHSHVNVGCAVQHDSVLGDYVTLSPGVFVNGDVVVGDDVFVGTGAVITRGTVVGDGAVIGAGAVVLADVAPGSRVVGAPARPR